MRPKLLFILVFFRQSHAQCDGGPLTITDAGGGIQSPNYPGTYPSNSDCKWIISSDAEVTITIEEMDIEEDGCAYDYMQISFAGGDTRGKICGPVGSLADPVFIGQGPAEIIFYSDTSVEPGPGFKASYQVAGAAEPPPPPPAPTDPCDPNPCQNGAPCTTFFGQARCNCMNTGYTGDFCEEDINECQSNPCLNNGQCEDLVNSYSCDCTGTGYSGDDCSVRDPFCASNPCQNGGQCSEGLLSYNCACTAGYEGTSCETNIDDCSPNPCQNGGSCQDGVNSYTCQCSAGFTGETCDQPLNQPAEIPDEPEPPVTIPTTTTTTTATLPPVVPAEPPTDPPVVETEQAEVQPVAPLSTPCSPNPCQNGASCSINGAAFTCTCTAMFKGTTCNEPKAASCSVASPCANDPQVICTDSDIGEATCNCPSYRSGQYCQQISGCYSSDFDTVFQVADRIRFNCTPGTVLAPNSAHEIVCNADGQLSADVPKCVRIQTGDAVAQRLTAWETVKAVKWIMAMFIMSLGIVFAMLGVAFYAFVLAPWNEHAFARFFKSGLSKVQDAVTVIENDDEKIVKKVVLKEVTP